MKPGWVPVTPKGRVLWDCAEVVRRDACVNSCYAADFGDSDRLKMWGELKDLGWKVVRCVVDQS